MSYTYTPQETIDYTRKVNPDGSITVGENIIDGQKVGDGVVGRGTAGEGTGAGSNIFKANAIEEIYKKGLGDDGTYMSNAGPIAAMTGVKEQDIDDYATTQDFNRLSKANNRGLTAKGLREVQWGDTKETIQDLYNTQATNKALKKTEPGRVKRETKVAQLEARGINREINARNEEGKRFEAGEKRADRTEKEDNRRFDLQDKRLWQDKQEGRQQRQVELQMNADNNKMQMQLEYSRLAQADKNAQADRKDKAMMMLLQGLGNLGSAFTV